MALEPSPGEGDRCTGPLPLAEFGISRGGSEDVGPEVVLGADGVRPGALRLTSRAGLIIRKQKSMPV
jgi:hypothetical protein